MKIGDVIKAKREELKENQEEFGKRFNLSHAAISDLEKGKTKHIPEAMVSLILSGKYREKCYQCNGTGYVERERQLI